MDVTTSDEFVTASEAARILGVTRQRIANMINDHDLDAVRPWPRTVLIRREALEQWKQGQRPTPIHKTAVRTWIFQREQVGGLDMLPLDRMTPLVREFIDESRPEWDDTSKTNWVTGMVGLLSRFPRRYTIVTCPICKDEFIVVTGGPDYWGNVDTDDCVCQTPCPTCRGARHLGPATGSPQRDWGKTCPDCKGTGAAYTAEEVADMAAEKEESA